MTREERKIALHCLKAYSDYHSEVCEECINYPNCDHTMQDDVTETIIKALEQGTVLDNKRILGIETRLQAIKEIANNVCLDVKDYENIAEFCDEIYNLVKGESEERNDRGTTKRCKQSTKQHRH